MHNQQMGHQCNLVNRHTEEHDWLQNRLCGGHKNRDKGPCNAHWYTLWCRYIQHWWYTRDDNLVVYPHNLGDKSKPECYLQQFYTESLDHMVRARTDLYLDEAQE